MNVVDTYLGLIHELLDGEVNGGEFQDRYFMTFKTETREMSDLEFKILDWLFAEVDEYVPDPELRQRAGGLDDDKLVDRVRQARVRLLDLR